MKGKKKRTFIAIFQYIGLCMIAFILLFPIIWMIMGTFKDNAELFGSLKLLPANVDFSAYREGWKGSGQFSYTTFFKNSFMLVIPTTFFTALSSLWIAYGFARFEFPLKNMWFKIMIATLMLPNAVLVIPRYLMFNRLGWVDSYKPFIIPAAFGCYPFFIYMFIQFYRGIPRELDEAARIDGCSSQGILRHVLAPLLKPVIVSCVIFQMSWTWEDFFNPLIYISSTKKFPISLALRMSLDTMSQVSYNQVLAMATVSLMPCTVLFFLSQKTFVEGVSFSGIKG